jgi:hypothetical protein
MLKDIAVHLPVDRPAGILIECAVSIARLFDAHLDGIACVYQALNPMIAPEAAAVILAADCQIRAEQATIILEQFELAAKRLGILKPAL